MKKQTNSKGNQLENTFENWLSRKIEYEISRFSTKESKRIHNKSKELLIAEADDRFKKEKDRIEKSLLSVPSKEKFIQSEIDIIYRILHKDIDYRNDCKRGGLNTDVIYYKTGRFEYDIKQVESIRHNYRIYLQGEINYIGKTPEIDYYKADNIIEAIKFYNLEEWLKVLRESKAVSKEPIIEKERLALIYRKYEDCFNESEDTWIGRFIYPNGPKVDPIDIDKKAITGSKKLLLLAILTAIEHKRKDPFVYNDFVLDRFGFKGYGSAKFKLKEVSKNYSDYKKIITECNEFLKE